MPNAYTLNQKPTTYGAAFSLLPEMLFGAGWTYQQSGDGVASFGSGKVFTNFTQPATANSWNNSGAWVRMRDPGGVKEITIQRDTPSTSNAPGIRLKFSPLAKFITGGSATATPSATDERILWGGGTDASPTVTTFFNTATLNGTMIYQGAALAGTPYGFWYASNTQGTLIPPNGGRYSTLMFDPVTAPAADTEPYVFHISFTFGFGYQNPSGAGFLAEGGTSNSAATNTWNKVAPGDGCFAYMDAAKTQFLYVQPAIYVHSNTGQTPGGNMPAMFSGGGTLIQSYLPANPFNGKADLMPVPYFRVQGQVTGTSAPRTEAPGMKGWSTLMRWTGMSRNTFVDTLDNKNWIAGGLVWLPWDGTTQPIG